MRRIWNQTGQAWRGLPTAVRIIAATAAALVLLASAALLALHGAPGRWIALSALDGRDLPGAGRIAITGLTGEIFRSPRIDRMTLSDSQGVWLEASGVALDWDGMAAIGRRIEIDALSIERVDIHRRPLLAASETSRANSGGDVSVTIRIGEADLSEIRLAEGVVGPAAVLRAEAAISAFNAEGGQARLLIERLDALGDVIRAELSLADGMISGDLSATGEAGGPFAALARLPDQPIALTAQLSGDRSGGGGQFSFLAGEDEAAAGDLDWSAGGWRLEAVALASVWSPDLARTLTPGGAARFAAAGGLRSPYLDEIEIEAPDISARLARTESGWSGEAVLAAALVDRLETGPVRAQQITWRGAVTTQDGLTIDGLVELEQPDAGQVRALRAAGPVRLAREDEDWRIHARLDVDRPRLADSFPTAVTAAVGETARLEFDGVWRGPTGRLDIDAARLASGGGETAVAGAIDVSAERVDLAAEIRVAEIALWTDQARGPFSASARLRGPLNLQNFDLEASFDARDLRSDAPWAEYARSLRGDIAVTLDGSAWNARRIRLRSQRVEIVASGVGQGAERWRIGGDAALAGGFEQGGIALDGALAAAFEASGGDGPVDWRVALAAPSVDLGERRLDDPRLEAEGRYADNALSGEWRFAAQAEDGDIIAAGGLARTGETVRLDAVEARFMDIVLTGDLDYAPDRLAIRSRFRPDGDAPEWSARLDYAGSPDALTEGDFDARLETLAPVRRAGIEIIHGAVSAQGRLSGLALSIESQGWMKERFVLTASGSASLTPDRMTVTLVPDGRWGDYALTTDTPLRLERAGPHYVAEGAVSLNGGGVSFAAQRDDAGGRIEIGAANLPVRLISDITGLPGMDGVFRLDAQLNQADGLWTGRVQAEADAIRAADLPPEAAAALSVLLDIGPEATHLQAALDSDISAGSLTVTRRGAVQALGDLGDADAPLDGAFSAEGRLANLTPIIFRGDQVLTGQLSARGSVSGSRAAPQLSGELSLRDGRYASPAEGFDFRGISLDAVFENDGLRMDRLSARDRHGGTLEGDGRLVFTEAVTGEAHVEFSRFRAIERAELDVTATGAADIAIGTDEIVISGEGEIDRLEARPSGASGASVPTIEVEEINLPPDRAPAPGRRRPIRLDYTVSADNGLFASGGSFDTEWAADLHVTGSALSPELDGELRLLAGTAYVFNRRFLLARDGTVTFEGAPEDAALALNATHSRTDFTVNASISGDIQTPEISLSSTPALPEDEILARLLFDRSSTQLSALETAQLASQLSGGGLLSMVGRLRSVAGVDRLDIASGENGGLAVTGGRRFGDDVYVEIQSDGAALAAAQVEWTLTPDLSLLSRLTGDTNASVSIRWRTEY